MTNVFENDDEIIEMELLFIKPPYYKREGMVDGRGQTFAQLGLPHPGLDIYLL